MTRAEKFYEVFGIKMDTTSDCGFFDCTNRPHCDGCPVRDTEAWWNGEYKEQLRGGKDGNNM